MPDEEVPPRPQTNMSRECFGNYHVFDYNDPDDPSDESCQCGELQIVISRHGTRSGKVEIVGIVINQG